MLTSQDVIEEFAHVYPLDDVDCDFVDQELYSAKSPSELWIRLHAIMSLINDSKSCNLAIPASIIYNLLIRDSFMNTLPFEDRYFIIKFAVHMIAQQARRSSTNEMFSDALCARWLKHVPPAVEAKWIEYFAARIARLERITNMEVRKSQLEFETSNSYMILYRLDPNFDKTLCDEIKLRVNQRRAVATIENAVLQWLHRRRAVAKIENAVLPWLHRPEGSMYRRTLMNFKEAQGTSIVTIPMNRL